MNPDALSPVFAESNWAPRFLPGAEPTSPDRARFTEAAVFRPRNLSAATTRSSKTCLKGGRRCHPGQRQRLGPAPDRPYAVSRPARRLAD